MGGRRAAVTFLESRASLRGVDPWFRRFTAFLHRVPFCATFGVSCSGYFTPSREKFRSGGEILPETFYPEPWGHLDIIVLPEDPLVRELLGVIAGVVTKHQDSSFLLIEHAFGPSLKSRAQVWEIRIGDNGCLGHFEWGENYFVGNISTRGNEAVYKTAKERCSQIRAFWKELEGAAEIFCREHNLTRFNLERRIDEIVNVWEEEN